MEAELQCAPFTLRELAILLALTAVPVPATSLLRGVLTSTSTLSLVSEGLESSSVSFVLYACCSWGALVGVVYTAGWSRLRAHGLRLVRDVRRSTAAVVALFVGVGIYFTVEIALRGLGLPDVAGMEYSIPSTADAVLLFMSAVVSAAYCEEVFFRVIWIGVLGTRISPILAAAAGLVAFALIHYPYFGLGGVLFVSVWAVLPSTLFLVFGDVTASLLLHVLNNTFAYIIVPLWLR